MSSIWNWSIVLKVWGDWLAMMTMYCRLFGGRVSTRVLCSGVDKAYHTLFPYYGPRYWPIRVHVLCVKSLIAPCNLLLKPLKWVCWNSSSFPYPWNHWFGVFTLERLDFFFLHVTSFVLEFVRKSGIVTRLILLTRAWYELFERGCRFCV